jgi:hypothetical protein
MSPHINETVVADRIDRALQQARHRTAVRSARQHAGRHPSMREAVGHGLIAIGARLVDKDTAPDPTSLGRAA